MKEISEKNKRNCHFMGPPHRTGRTSCANIRRDMEQVGKPTDKLSVYIEMRTDKSRNLKDPVTADRIREFEELLEGLTEEEQNSIEKRNEIFEEVMGPDGHGHVRTIGTGPTPSQMNREIRKDVLAFNYKEELKKEIIEEVKKDILASNYADVLKKEIIEDMKKQYDDKITELNSKIESLTSQLVPSQLQVFEQ